MRRATGRWVLAVLLLAGCPGRGLDAVVKATTPAEERAAFEALVGAGGVGFTAHAADGARLDLGEADWWKRVHRLHLRAGGRSIDHVVIDPANIAVLMRE